MRLHFNAYLATSLVFSSSLYHVTADSTTTSISIRGTRSASQTSSIEENLSTSNTRFLIPKERRLLPHEGVMRTIIIRVTDGEGKQPITDARRESDTWFGTHGLALAGNLNSLTGLYEQCSGGKLSFVPSTGPGVVDGVLELAVSQNMTGLHVSTAGQIARNEFNLLNQNLGIEFDNYSIILPYGVKGSGGLARQGGNHQFYAGGADRSLELVMHEFGHTLGFHHSGLPNEGDYDDNSCMMGCCAGAQQMCFNAAKSWYSGWYTEGHVMLNHLSTPGQWGKVNLVGIDDYLRGVFGESNSFVANIGGGLFMVFNRKKGINSGVKAYGDEVVIVQQWGEGGKSKVLAHLANNESNRRVEFNRIQLYTDFDIAIEVCDIVFAPVVTGPQIDVTDGLATQSSTAAGAEATRAIDGNLDQSWLGGSVTHTSGDEEDLDPWWELSLAEAQQVQHVRIFNRNDCCGNRLNNAILELYNDEGELTYRHNLGAAEDIKEVRLGENYLVSRVKIQLLGYKVLSLAEVQLFAPSQLRQEPDYASVLVSISDGSGSQEAITCDSTMAPSISLSPSSRPTTSHTPTVYTAVPKDVVLLRDDVPCVFQSNPSQHPDRFKCTIQPTTASDEPGDYGNAPVGLKGKDGCLIFVSPVTWSWAGTAFVFESSASLEAINNCFAAGVLLSEMLVVTDSPTSAPFSSPTNNPSVTPSLVPSSAHTNIPSTTSSEGPSSAPTNILTVVPSLNPTVKSAIPDGVVLRRDNTPCISQVNPSNHPDRFKCMINPTTISSEPGTYNNDPVGLVGVNCIIYIRPVTWAWEGNAFIFQSMDSIEAINNCFAAGVVMSERRAIIPDNIDLLRDNTPCIFQSNPSNHPDRFKCMLEPTAISSEPGTYNNDLLALRGLNGCVIDVRPVTWAWEGNAFIFQSVESLDVINDCFASGVLISESGYGAAEDTLFG